MPTVKTKSGVKHFSYGKKGVKAAKAFAKKVGKKMDFKGRKK